MQLAGAAEVNKHYLKLVDAALFVLCLDHTSPSTAAEVYMWSTTDLSLKQRLSVCVVGRKCRLRYVAMVRRDCTYTE